MPADPNVQRIDDKLRNRANFAEGCAWVLGVFSLPALFDLVYLGLVAFFELAVPLPERLLGVLGYLLLLGPVALGVGQLHFYRRRGRGERIRGPYFWWGSATVLNAALMLVLGGIALAQPPWLFFHETFDSIGIPTYMLDTARDWYVDHYGIGFEKLGFVAVACTTYNSFAALIEEHDLAEHRRWLDILGPNVHASIA